MASKTQITSEGARLLATSTRPDGVHWWIGWYALAYVPPEIKADDGEKLTPGSTKLTEKGDIIYNIFQGDSTGEGYVSTTGPNDQFGLVHYDGNIKKNYRYVMDSEGRNNLVTFVDGGKGLKGAHVYRGINVGLPIGGNLPDITESEIPLPAPLLYVGSEAGDKGYSGNGASEFLAESNGYYPTIKVNYDDMTGEIDVPRVSTDFRQYAEYKRGVDAGADDAGQYIGNLPLKFNGTDTPIDADGWAKSEATYKQGGKSDLKQDYNVYCKEYWKALSISNFNKYCAPVNSAGLAYDEDCGCRNMSKATKYFPIYRYDVLNTEKKESNEYVTGIKLGIKLNVASKNIGGEPYYKNTEPSSDGSGVASLNNDFKNIEDRSGNQIFASETISFKFNRIGIYAVPMRQYGCTGDNVKKAQFQIDTEMEPVLFAICDWDEAHILSDSGDGLTTFESSICIDLATAVENSALIRESALYYNVYEDESIEWYKNQLLANASTSEAVMQMQMDIGYIQQKLDDTNKECCNEDDREWAAKNHTHDYLKNLVDAADVESNSVRNIKAMEEDEILPGVYDVNTNVDVIGVNYGPNTILAYGGDTPASVALNKGSHLGVYYGTLMLGDTVKPSYVKDDVSMSSTGTVNTCSTSPIMKAKLREHVVWVGKYGYLNAPLYAPVADYFAWCNDAYSLLTNNVLLPTSTWYTSVSATYNSEDLILPVDSSGSWDSLLELIQEKGDALNTEDLMNLWMNATKIEIKEIESSSAAPANRIRYYVYAYDSTGRKLVVRRSSSSEQGFTECMMYSKPDYSIVVTDEENVDYIMHTYDVNPQPSARYSIRHTVVHRHKSVELPGCCFYRFDADTNPNLADCIFPTGSKWRIPTEDEWQYLIDNVTDDDIIKFRANYGWDVPDGSGLILPSGFMYSSASTNFPTLYDDNTFSVFMIKGSKEKVVKFDGDSFEIIETSSLESLLPGITVVAVNVLPICDGTPITSDTVKTTMGDDSYALMQLSLTTGDHSFNASYNTKILGDHSSAIGSDHSVIGDMCNHVTLLGGMENSVYGTSSSIAVVNGYGNSIYQSVRSTVMGRSNSLVFVPDSFIHGSYNAITSIGSSMNLMLNGDENQVSATSPAVLSNLFINGTRNHVDGTRLILESSIINGRDYTIKNLPIVSSAIANLTSLMLDNASICESLASLSNIYDRTAFNGESGDESNVEGFATIYRAVAASGGKINHNIYASVYANGIANIDAQIVGSSLFATHQSNIKAENSDGTPYHDANIWGVIYTKSSGVITTGSGGINYSLLTGEFNANNTSSNAAMFHCCDVFQQSGTLNLMYMTYSSIHGNSLNLNSTYDICSSDFRGVALITNTSEFDFSAIRGNRITIASYDVKYSSVIGYVTTIHTDRYSSCDSDTRLEYANILGYKNKIESEQCGFSSIIGSNNTLGKTVKNDNNGTRISTWYYSVLCGSDNDIDVSNMKYGFIIGNDNTFDSVNTSCAYITVHGAYSTFKSASLSNMHFYGHFKLEDTTSSLSNMLIMAANMDDSVGGGSTGSSYVAEFSTWLENLGSHRYPMLVSEGGIALYGNKVVLGNKWCGGKAPEVGDLLTVIGVEGNVATVAWKKYSGLTPVEPSNVKLIFSMLYHPLLPGGSTISDTQPIYITNNGFTSGAAKGTNMVYTDADNPGSVSAYNGYITLYRPKNSAISGYDVTIEMIYKSDVAKSTVQSTGSFVKSEYLHANPDEPTKEEFLAESVYGDSKHRYLFRLVSSTSADPSYMNSSSAPCGALNADGTSSNNFISWEWKKADDFATSKKCICTMKGKCLFGPNDWSIGAYGHATLFGDAEDVEFKYTITPC